MTTRASALVLQLHRQATASKAQAIRLAVGAAEASLPEDVVLQAGVWTDPRTYEAVYRQPSSALHVLRGLQDSVRRCKFRAAVAAGDYWTDLIRVNDEAVKPQALTLARALSGRLEARDTTWVAFQGYGAWNEVATAAFSLTCNVRNNRSTWQREAEAAYRQTDHIGRAASILGVHAHTAGLRLRRASIQNVDVLDLVLARQLDAGQA